MNIIFDLFIFDSNSIVHVALMKRCFIIYSVVFLHCPNGITSSKFVPCSNLNTNPLASTRFVWLSRKRSFFVHESQCLRQFYAINITLANYRRGFFLLLRLRAKTWSRMIRLHSQLLTWLSLTHEKGAHDGVFYCFQIPFE